VEADGQPLLADKVVRRGGASSHLKAHGEYGRKRLSSLRIHGPSNIESDESWSGPLITVSTPAARPCSNDPRDVFTTRFAQEAGTGRWNHAPTVRGEVAL
jgi:hypothetical protein